MSEFLMSITNGLVMGIIYSLSALGISLIAGTMKVMNFAHGELYVLAGYLSYHLSASFGLPPLCAMPLAVLLTFLFGWVIERALIRPTYGDDMRSLIITFVLSIVLQNAFLLAFGPFPRKPAPLLEGASHLGGLFYYGNQRLLSAGLALLIIASVFALLHSTWFGKSIRAVASDRAMASLLGIDPVRVNAIAFGLGAALAGAAGICLSSIFPVTPTAGSAVSLTAFVVVVLGGMGSLKGCVVGGLALGLIENLGAAYLSTQYVPLFGFLLLILTLVLRPAGLYGRKT